MINADSAQVYADLAVLSARPSVEEMQGVPHRLFGEWDGATACSAADWANKCARRDCEGHARGRRADPCRRNRTVPAHLARWDRARCRRSTRRCAMLCAQCRWLQPTRPCWPKIRIGQSAAFPNDTTRMARALEVVRSTGRPLGGSGRPRRSGGIGEWRNASTRWSCSPRATGSTRALRPALCTLMLEQRRASTKCSACWPANSTPHLPVMRAIGVPEIAAYLWNGEITLAEAKARGAAGHPQLRQAPVHLVPPPAAARLAANRVDKITTIETHICIIITSLTIDMLFPVS